MFNKKVGGNHNDNSRLRRHGSINTDRQNSGRRVLYMRRARHCLAHSHHRQQLHRVLQRAKATREEHEVQRGTAQDPTRHRQTERAGESDPRDLNSLTRNSTKHNNHGGSKRH